MTGHNPKALPDKPRKPSKALHPGVAKFIANTHNYDGIAIIGVNLKTGEVSSTSWGHNEQSIRELAQFVEEIYNHAEIKKSKKSGKS